MSKRSTHAHLLALLAALCLAQAAAPDASAQKEAPASVSGRVRDGERGAVGINVVLLSNEPAARLRQVARARTDADGRYLLSNVAPGRYQIMPVAPVYVLQDMPVEVWPPGRPLTLLAGEAVSDVDFSVERGGVITGRVTDEGGNPVIAEPVNVEAADDKTPQPQRQFDPRNRQTDDRGVYRVYGLAPGRYRVSVGTAGENGAVGFGRRKVFERTYYPGVTDKDQARLVELKAGEESADVDIAIGRAIKTYRASGRFVFADTGQPAPGINFAYFINDRKGGVAGGFGGGGMATNERGEFYTEPLAPGRYTVFAAPNWSGPSEFYTDAVAFEVTNADVTGLVVSVKRGATVSGSVTVEGVTDRALLSKLLSQVRVYGFVETDDRSTPWNGSRPSPLNPDGSFQMTGLRPGKLRLFYNEGEGSKSLSLLRVELNGAPVGNDGIPVTEGAQITGARIRLNYGTGVIRGQVNFVNGTPPPNARILVMARAVSPGAAGGETGAGTWRRAEADVRGLFRLEGLPAGEYELFVNVVNGGNRPVAPARQRVTVADGAEVSVSPAIDFDKPPAPRPPGVVVTPPNP
jgi:hypothetical protein